MERYKGNITIEAAVVVPVMLMILMTLLMSALVLHDIYVLRTANVLEADAWVIAGEAAGTSVMDQTFIIEAEVASERVPGMFRDRFSRSVAGGAGLIYFDMFLEADETREVSVRKPKTYVRTVDFFDDGSDMWQVTAEMKSEIEKKVEAIEDVLVGE